MSTPPPRLLGEDGLPVRAIAFSSGGVDTAMQLGVTHALLTIQGKAPDAVVGCSAGAVNAVALAEILQAGTDPTLEEDWEAINPVARQQLIEERQRTRVSRFRQVFDAFLSAPGELGRAYLPDMLQVEARKPLASLELPIHDALERDGRDREVFARHGLIKLINDLLSLRISIASLTRFIRRGLGCKAAGEIRSPIGRWLARGFEVARIWALIGVNLSRAAWVLRPLLKPFLAWGEKPDKKGANAGEIIGHARWRKEVSTALRHLVGVVGLWITWVAVTLVGFTLPYGLVRLISLLLYLLALTGIPGPQAAMFWIELNILPASLIAGSILAGVVTYLFAFTNIWGQIVQFNRSSTKTIVREVAWEALTLVLMLGLWFFLPVLLVDFTIHPEKLLAGLRAWGFHIGNVVGTVINVAWLLIAVMILVAILMGFRKTKDSYLRRMLARYDIADGLLSVHPLRQLFVRLFDPNYYGDRQMDHVVDRALQDDYEASHQPPREKLVGNYEQKGQSPPIAVGLMVANLAALRDPPVGTQRVRDIVEIVPPETKVVDGLLAATAVSPLFPPVPVRDRLFIDGANVSIEATHGLLHMLRERVNPRSTVVDLYSVSHLPFSSPTLRPEPVAGGAAANGAAAEPEYLRLVDVAYRSFLLHRFRDAALERRMTELFTKAMPPGQAVTEVDGKKFLRVWVAPVEPEEPLEVAERLARCCSAEEKRKLISETVADGCRAALEVMIRDSLPETPDQVIGCRLAVSAHLDLQSPQWLLPLLADVEPAPPDAVNGPGLPEVCRHCQLSKRWAAPAGAEPPRRSLVIRPWEQVGRAWPHEYEVEERLTDAERLEDRHFLKSRTAYEERSRTALRLFQETVDDRDRRFPEERRWPRTRFTGAGKVRPLVSFVFSGGVFRGVYQLGTLNALAEAGLEPDVIAGASVGSITAAMVAQAYCSPPGAERDGRIARLAATYLAMDRLILTDRFADFIRGLTLRAAESRFSLRQADGFFRRFDQSDPQAFNREARTVVAGLERLFWLSPFELMELVRAFRLRQPNMVFDQLRAHTQEWLERMGVGNQVLGSEPLELLMAEHVLQRIPGERWIDQQGIPFDRYLRSAGMYFLATTTNLTLGRLEVLGEQQLDPDGVSPFLKEGLLASSAFPGVFRPRWSWEVMPGTNVRHQYVDGGMMDNLPLDAVAEFFHMASSEGLMKARPEYPEGVSVPHLVFSASLQINPATPTPDELQRFPSEWPLVLGRTRQLKYNKKLDLFAETQRALRAMHRAHPGPFVPVDLEVVMVRPRWLCGTFGFHPMLGFRQQKQAESIAHGCATGLLELARVRRDHPDWARGWNLDRAPLPKNPPATDRDPIVPGSEGKGGRCWFRPDELCTFSRERLAESKLPETTIAELDRIHAACGRRRTHEPSSN